MTPSFVSSVLTGEGFALIHEETWEDSPNPQWQWWGGVAERRALQSASVGRQEADPGPVHADLVTAPTGGAERRPRS